MVDRWAGPVVECPPCDWQVVGSIPRPCHTKGCKNATITGTNFALYFGRLRPIELYQHLPIQVDFQMLEVNSYFQSYSSRLQERMADYQNPLLTLFMSRLNKTCYVFNIQGFTCQTFWVLLMLTLHYEQIVHYLCLCFFCVLLYCVWTWTMLYCQTKMLQVCQMSFLVSSVSPTCVLLFIARSITWTLRLVRTPGPFQVMVSSFSIYITCKVDVLL